MFRNIGFRLFLIIVVSFFINTYFSISSDSLAQGIIPGPKPGDYCGFTVECQSDIAISKTCHLDSNLNHSYSETGRQQCKAYDDLQCQGGQGCVTLYKSNIYVDPPNPQLGQNVKVTISSTQNCTPNPQISLDIGLGNQNKFSATCTPISTSPSCSGNSKDDLRCSWEYNCIAYQLSNRFGDTYSKYSITYNSSANSSCSSTTNYTVTEPKDCVQPSGLSTVDPLGEKTNQIVSKNLNDDNRDVLAMNKGLFPEELNQQIAQQQCTTLPTTGVQTGFFLSSAIRKLICENPVSQLLGLSWCPVQVNIASQQTECFKDQSVALVNSIRPEGITPIPPPSSCYLLQAQYVQDKISQNQLNQLTKGNSDINDITTSLGTGNNNVGVYNYDAPQMSEIPVDSQNYNISLDTRPFVEDNRVPGTNCWQELMYKKMAPDGVEPPAAGCLKK